MATWTNKQHHRSRSNIIKCQVEMNIKIFLLPLALLHNTYQVHNRQLRMIYLQLDTDVLHITFQKLKSSRSPSMFNAGLSFSTVPKHRFQLWTVTNCLLFRTMSTIAPHAHLHKVCQTNESPSADTETWPEFLQSSLFFKFQMAGQVWIADTFVWIITPWLGVLSISMCNGRKTAHLQTTSPNSSSGEKKHRGQWRAWISILIGSRFPWWLEGATSWVSIIERNWLDPTQIL